jgi:DNA-binding HxlR family transcriptional regulator
MVSSAPKQSLRANPVPLARCSIAQAIELIGDRWTLLILREALYGITRFEDFMRDLNCPRSILASRLRKLEHQGLMFKDPYQDAGQRPRNAYKLTPQARALALPLLAMMQWMDTQMRQDRAPITVRATDGRELKVALVDDAGTAVALDQIRMTLSISAEAV